MYATTVLQKVDRALAPDVSGSDGPILDLEHLNRYTCGDIKLEGEVLQLFAAHLPSTLKSLQDASTGREWAVAAHTIKGSARAIGAWRLAALVEQVEKLDNPKSFARREAFIPKIEARATEVLDFIKTRHPA